MKQEKREQLLKEVLGKKRSLHNLNQEAKELVDITNQELLNLIQSNQQEILQLSKELNFTDEDFENLRKDIEKDFHVKVEDTTIPVNSKDIKVIFQEMEENLNRVVLGQAQAIKDMIVALKRPYVIGSHPDYLKNTILIHGNNGTGRHLLVKEVANELLKHKLSPSNEIAILDMQRYQSSSQETIFLQDLYMALNGNAGIIAVEHITEGYTVFNRMLQQLVVEKRIVLNKRYTLKHGYLQEATSGLVKDAIDVLTGNGKLLVFLTDKKMSDVLDTYGKQFIDTVVDKIETIKLNDAVIGVIVDKLLESLLNKMKVQLKVQVQLHDSVKQWLLSKYQPSDGMDSITPFIQVIYNALVDVVLNHHDVSEVEIQFDETLMIKHREEWIKVDLRDDSLVERQKIQEELDRIVGLDEVKEYLLSLEDHLKITNLRKQKGLKVTEVSKHMIFTGNPGTGKTTIARLVSRLMKVAGVLKQGQLVEVTRQDLVGKYVGHTAPLTMSVIQSALGGVLFIDEAYSLYRGKDDSFGLEAIDTLVKAMEDYRDDLIVILAGYSKEMSEFLTSNSGLKSRFANIIHFKDYTGMQLLQIARIIAQSKEYKLNMAVEKPLLEYFLKVQADNSQTSGNGRLARNVIEDAILKQAKRILKNPDADMLELVLEDFDVLAQDNE